MENYIQADDYELWMLIKNGPLIPKKATEDGKIIPKKLEEFNAEDFTMMEMCMSTSPWIDVPLIID